MGAPIPTGYARKSACWAANRKESEHNGYSCLIGAEIIRRTTHLSVIKSIFILFSSYYYILQFAEMKRFKCPVFSGSEQDSEPLNQEARTASVRNKCRRHSFSSAFKTSVAAWRTSSAGSVAFISFNVGVIRGA